MQETRPPTGGPNRIEVFDGENDAVVNAKMNNRLVDLRKEGHELVGREKIGLPHALVSEIIRCEELLKGPGSVMRKAGLRRAIGQAKEALVKLKSLENRLNNCYSTLKGYE